jgi:hypothetical protein
VLARNNASVRNKALVWSSAMAAGLQVAGVDRNAIDQSSWPFFSDLKVRSQTAPPAKLKLALSGMMPVETG